VINDLVFAKKYEIITEKLGVNLFLSNSHEFIFKFKTEQIVDQFLGLIKSIDPLKLKQEPLENLTKRWIEN
jgi:hypothetical protein